MLLQPCDRLINLPRICLAEFNQRNLTEENAVRRRDIVLGCEKQHAFNKRWRFLGVLDIADQQSFCDVMHGAIIAGGRSPARLIFWPVADWKRGHYTAARS